ncbi:uncharacterized protein YgbK (DUF1537 family) [Diaminobutyricimonas aerilata]|uniref:3-oxo-tetronate kinase n=1 Tax=Diaminobutyricimonas aerilata TaxID=1162967 RepID=A0A2M9CLU8_9MICO|nr:3-oxo-tetronate kinase [Diaminobutyricimonas aerilata]PJJ72869.1 uncharacterized protein YgbK (DUF1537 family) [Diaminobutyricimonas aerilata]
MSGPFLGVIADDVTGACDLAGTVAELGHSTSVHLGAPHGDLDADADCIVVALKTRTIDPDDAVAHSVAAARALLDAGAARLYQKYCSTFDSTPRGNIGPVADALLALLGRDAVSIGTPATPQAGRTQYLGHLFVHDRLLSESSLRDHPLTPMRDPDLVRVLSAQSAHRVGLVPHAAVRWGPSAVVDAVRSASAEHVLVDALDDGDLDVIAAAIDDVDSPVLLGGGAGLAAALARRALPATAAAPLPAVEPGRRLVLSGSGSERTREQVAAFAGTVLRLDPLALAGDPDALDALLAATDEALAGDAAVLVSATDEPDAVRRAQTELGVERAAGLVEDALARIAVHAVDRSGVRRLIVAGGETSGAVAAALGATTLRIGRLAAPGVPWAVADREGVLVALLLKSGNFGGRDLFTTAWESAP